MQFQLADCEVPLALFAEGIAGRYLHLRSANEFSANPRLNLAITELGQSQDALYLPESVDSASDAAYRVLIMQQLGMRECATLTFRMSVALTQVLELAERYSTLGEHSPRTGDFRLLFDSFSVPGLAEKLFLLLEQARIDAHLRRTYPGLVRHLRSHHSFLLEQAVDEDADPTDLVSRGQAFIYGAPDQPTSALEALLINLLKQQSAATSVYQSVKGLCILFDMIDATLTHAEANAFASDEDSAIDWLNREQRIEEWEQELEDVNEQLADQSMALQMATGEETEAVLGDVEEGTTREAELEIKDTREERDTLKRRIDMEKSAVSHALGQDRSNARSFRYDEWDCLNRRYLRAWCRVYEQDLTPSADEDLGHLQSVIRSYQNTVQRQLEHIRPSGLERIRRVQDGDELDLNAIIEARQDLRAGHSPDERFYSRKERVQRDVCAVFLVDLSASTDDPIEAPEAKDWSDYDTEAELDLRAGWYSSLAPEEEPEEPKRKIKLNPLFNASL